MITATIKFKGENDNGTLIRLAEALDQAGIGAKGATQTKGGWHFEIEFEAAVQPVSECEAEDMVEDRLGYRYDYTVLCHCGTTDFRDRTSEELSAELTAVAEYAVESYANR